ncbi:MAG: sugar phosphate isomerase/epimerase [Clostridia bacterium]|nr:sugar phosphate isomerase/epimerase [Clostridia bacterium]
MSLPVAVQVYSVRDDAKADLRATLEKIRDMGYDGVEFAGLYGNSPADIKAMLDEIGLTAVSAHVPFADLRRDAKGVIADYVTLGCKWIAVPYLDKEDRPGSGDFDKTIADIEAIGKEAKAQGIQLLYHNHDFEFVKVGQEYALDILYSSISADYLQTELDTCWVKVGGEDPAQYIMKYANRSPLVHLKDFKGSKSENMYGLIGKSDKAETSSTFELRPVGFGVQEWPSILEASEKAGAQWVIVEQDSATMGKTPLESIKMARDYLKILGY